MNNKNLFAEKTSNTQIGNTANVTIFSCANAAAGQFAIRDSYIKMACSAMVRDVFLLRAFEAGAEGVLVIGCSPQHCKREIGSSYASKRVERTKRLLDEIGLGGWRLAYAEEQKAGEALAALSAEIASFNSNRGSQDSGYTLPYVPGDYAALQDKKYHKLIVLN